MEFIRRVVILRYDYHNPADRRRAEGLLALSAVTILTMVLVLPLSAILWEANPFRPLVIGVEILLLVLSLFPMILLQRGRLVAAAGVYVIFFWAAAFMLTVTIGVIPLTALTFGLPIMTAWAILNRQQALSISVLVIISMLLAGLWVELVLQPGGDALLDTVAVSLTLSFYSLILGVFASEYREIDERLRAEQNLEYVASVGQQITRMADTDTFLDDVCNLLRVHFNLRQARVFLQDEARPDKMILRGSTGLIALHSGTGLLGQSSRLDRNAIPITESSPLGEAFLKQDAVVVTRNDPPSRRSEFGPVTEAELILPLLVGDTILGVLDLQSAEQTHFQDEKTVAVFTALATELSFSIRNARLEAQVDQYGRELDELYTHYQQNNIEIQQLNQQIGEEAWGRFFEGRGTEVVGYDLPSGAETPLPGKDIPDTLKETLGSGEVTVRKTDAGHLLSVPIILRGHVLGAMEFQIAGHNTLPQHLLDLATTITARLSLALDNARLIERVQALAEREQQVGEIAGRLQGAGDLERLLDLAAQEFNKALGGTRTNIRLQLREGQSGDRPKSANGGGAS